MKEVKPCWESGNPVTRPEVYNLLRNSYDPSTSFHKLYLVEKKLSSLSQWFSRVLSRHGWTIRETTISQKVPVNWKEIAKEDSFRICAKMRAAGGQRLINADQSFFCFCFFPSQPRLMLVLLACQET